MNSIENDIHPLVQALLEPVPQSSRDDLALQFALCLQYNTSNDSHELVTVDARKVAAVSRKSANAFLDMKRFLHTVGELVLEGYAMYQAPFLFLPIAFRMMKLGNKLISRELGNLQTALVIALHATPSLGSDLSQLFAQARVILRKAGLQEASDHQLITALEDLLQLRCIKRTSGNVLQISETVELAVVA